MWARGMGGSGTAHPSTSCPLPHGQGRHCRRDEELRDHRGGGAAAATTFALGATVAAVPPRGEGEGRGVQTGRTRQAGACTCCAKRLSCTLAAWPLRAVGVGVGLTAAAAAETVQWMVVVAVVASVRGCRQVANTKHPPRTGHRKGKKKNPLEERQKQESLAHKKK